MKTQHVLFLLLAMLLDRKHRRKHRAALKDVDRTRVPRAMYEAAKDVWDEVVELIAGGLTNKEIAHKLHLSTYTVKSHVHNILEKLALHTRLEIATFAHTDDGYREQTHPPQKD